jgi:hypothetical protein
MRDKSYRVLLVEFHYVTFVCMYMYRGVILGWLVGWLCFIVFLLSKPLSIITFLNAFNLHWAHDAG